MREIDSDSMADPGDLRLRSGMEGEMADVIIAVLGHTLWLTVADDGAAWLRWRYLRPTYGVWRLTCER